MKWLLASERPMAMHTIAMQHQGVLVVARQVAHALRADPTPEQVRTVELALMTAVAAATGYAVSKYALAGAAGRPVSRQLDDEVRATLAGMLRSYLGALR